MAGVVGWVRRLLYGLSERDLTVDWHLGETISWLLLEATFTLMKHWHAMLMLHGCIKVEVMQRVEIRCGHREIDLVFLRK